MSNPISDYMAQHDLGTVEMANLLGVSKGFASGLKHGDKPITLRVAKRLSELTGVPWWEYLPEGARARSHHEGSAA